MDIWTSWADGSEAQRLTSMETPGTGSPAWSPDGVQIAFDSRAEGRPAIYVVPAGGGKPTKLTNGPGSGVVPFWSPDGRWIYFSSDRSGSMQVWKIRVNGQESQQITRSGGFAPIASRDGARLYYLKSNTTVSSLWELNLANGGERQIAPSVLNRAFAVADKGIYFFYGPSSGPYALNFFDLHSGESRAISMFAKRPHLGMAVSPDGTFLFYAQLDQSGHNLMLVEDFWR
jgi:Tol biopolymer transport system component